MQTQTVLFIILAVIVALILVLVQYYHRQKTKGKTIMVLSFLRFISIFGVLLLLINPKFIQNQYQIEKANLVLLVDNSSSVKNESNIIKKTLEELGSSKELKSKFNISAYSFGESFRAKDSLTFLEKNTNITKALRTTEDIYGRTTTVGVLLTDGNQTIGRDYENIKLKKELRVFPICIGDTTVYEDVRVEQINTNPYSFLNNKFPVEAVINYDGNSNINKTVSVFVDGKKEYQEKLYFSEKENSKIIQTNVTAKSIGVKSITISVETLKNEKNEFNNKKSAYIEVIDETTKIGLVSSILHPDIGALKKSIEVNEQRQVFIISPNTDKSSLENIDVFILYQPNSSFTQVYDFISKKKVHTLTISGIKTDWRFLNSVQRHIAIKNGYPIQDVLPKLNSSFSKFDVSEFSVNDYPPLETNAGPITLHGKMESILKMTIKGVDIDNPLLIVSGETARKDAYWFGENIWKWRVQEYRNSKDFKNFDDFIAKIMVYLTSYKNKNRLNVDYKSVYQGSNNEKITATYFDESFTFDSNAKIMATIINKETGVKKEVPMLLVSNFFELDISNLTPGKYSFNISVLDKSYSKSGFFSITDFDVEKQFLSANTKKLERLASKTNGRLFFSNKTTELKKQLVEDNALLPVQKKTENIVPLVDFRILLGIIALALTIEWFLRKYYGLI
ncbi:vWA domain-containing protein [uncultured Maribacter sp.]|uniref:vWA domain-containing protein n=1 Tax=uncultured Maribacter sp. TaxID=431308 RepID=UPI00260FF0A5|nr:vWA domain-containing protein [uncultured Maribacter sp.]